LNIKSFLFTILCLILIKACKPSEAVCGDLSDVVITYNIADSNKVKIPYKGSDTLIFISDANDTSILIGQSKKTYYQNIIKGLSSGDCPRSSVEKYETIDYYYRDVNSVLTNFKFTTDLYYNFGGKPTATYISLLINNIEISHSAIEYINSIKSPEDSVYLNNNYIGGIYWEFNSVRSTLFSFKYGILKFRYGNKIWTLNAIKQ